MHSYRQGNCGRVRTAWQTERVPPHNLTRARAQYLACCCSIAACLTGSDEINDLAQLLDCVADVLWCSVCACMQTQHKAELDARDSGRVTARGGAMQVGGWGVGLLWGPGGTASGARRRGRGALDRASLSCLTACRFNFAFHANRISGPPGSGDPDGRLPAAGAAAGLPWPAADVPLIHNSRSDGWMEATACGCMGVCE